MRTEAARVDAWLFERLVREAVDTVEDDPAEACRLLDQALALWRGPAHAEFIQFAWAWGGVSP